MKSSREPDSVTFQGNFITLENLKQLIVKKRGLDKVSNDFDLLISNADTKQLYQGAQTKVPKNVQLVVQRVSAAFGINARNQQRQETRMSNDSNAPSGADDDFGGDVFDTSTAATEAAEEETGGDSLAQKIAMFAAQKNKQLKDKKRKEGGKRLRNTLAGPPGSSLAGVQSLGKRGQNYDPEKRRNIGIPGQFISKDDENDGGVDGDGSKKNSTTGTGWGRFQTDARFKQRVKQAGGITTRLSDDEVRQRIDRQDIPADLVCALTDKLLKEAVILPCCNKSCSGEAIQSALVNSDFVCPLCKTKDISLDRLVPNQRLRKEVNDFIRNQREKLETSAAQAAEKAAAEAESERQKKLAETQSFSRPDAVLDLRSEEQRAADEKREQEDAEAAAAAADAATEEDGEKKEDVNDNTEKGSAGADSKQNSPVEISVPSAKSGSGWAKLSTKESSAPRSSQPTEMNGHSTPQNHSRDPYYDQRGQPRGLMYDYPPYDQHGYPPYPEDHRLERFPPGPGPGPGPGPYRRGPPPPWRDPRYPPRGPPPPEYYRGRGPSPPRYDPYFDDRGPYPPPPRRGGPPPRGERPPPQYDRRGPDSDSVNGQSESGSQFGRDAEDSHGRRPRKNNKRPPPSSGPDNVDKNNRKRQRGGRGSRSGRRGAQR